MLFVTCLISIFFGGPATILTWIHIKNYSAGKTTNERFAKGATTKGEMSEISESLGSVSDLRDVKSNND
jgi:hypothetical protein